ncbi:MAG: 30S ribosome-binding factor RbfA [Acidimicrobiia bacterium]
MKRSRGSRMRKVNELMREVIAEEAAKLKDPRIGFLTITDVRTSPDLRTAKVYFSVLDEEDKEGTAAALKSAHHRLQRAVANQAHLKYTPVLEFEVDDALERGLRISKLLHELEVEDE